MWVGYFNRSLNYVKEQATKGNQVDQVYKGNLDVPKRLPMYQFHTVEQLQEWIIGSDADMGGSSQAYWGLGPQKTGFIVSTSFVLGSFIHEVARKHQN